MAIARVAEEVCVSSFPNRLHPARLLACMLVACAHAAPAPAPAPPPVAPAVGVVASSAADPVRSQARWFAVALEGEPVGRTHEVVEGVAGGGFATRVASEIRIGRLGKVVEMATDFTLTEDAQGALQAVRGETRLSRQVTTSEVSFAAGAATVREAAGGPVHTRSVAIAGRPACAAERDGVAGLAFRDGPALYVLEARGPKPRALLDAVAGGVRLDASPR
jgi:predicted methyltransferase